MAANIKTIHTLNTSGSDSGGYGNVTVKSATDNVMPMGLRTHKYTITSTMLERCNMDYATVKFHAQVWNESSSEWKEVYFLALTHEVATMTVDDFVSKHTRELENIVLAILF